MEFEKQRIDMPENVKEAVSILNTTWIVGVVYAVYHIINESIIGDKPSLTYVFALLVALALYAFCYFLYGSIRRGRNVARIFFIGLTIVGLPMGLFKYFPMLLVPKVEGYIGVSSIVAQTYAAYLLATAQSRPWFHRNKSIKV